MDIRRSVSCSLWSDEWIEQLNPTAKLVFIYLLTNPLSNILGIYKLSIQRMSFETGIDKSTIEKTLKAFQSDKKVLYVDGFVILINHLKHQSLNPNMKTNVLTDYKELPNELKDRLQLNALEGFESLSNALSTLRKIEIEIEEEIKEEKEIIYTDFFEKFWEAYSRKGSKSESFAVWKKLKIEKSPIIMEELMAHVRRYVDVTERGFLRDAERYLKTKYWEGK